jgi:hypothetical protein
LYASQWLDLRAHANNAMMRIHLMGGSLVETNIKLMNRHLKEAAEMRKIRE